MMNLQCPFSFLSTLMLEQVQNAKIAVENSLDFSFEPFSNIQGSMSL